MTMRFVQGESRAKTSAGVPEAISASLLEAGLLGALVVPVVLASATCASATPAPPAEGGSRSGDAPVDRAYVYEVGPEQARALAAADTVSTVQVSGTGRVEVTPDRAQVLFAVETQAETAEGASTRNAARMDAVLAALRDTGMPGLELETRGYSLEPQYRRPDSGDAPEIDGFRARNNVEATISAPDSVGVVIDAAIAAGANRVASLSFLASDTEEARLQALGNAVERARSEAEAIAEALGMSVGRALEVTGGAESPPEPFPMRLEALSLQSSPTPVEPGSQTISANVTIRYALRQMGQ